MKNSSPTENNIKDWINLKKYYQFQIFLMYMLDNTERKAKKFGKKLEAEVRKLNFVEYKL